MRRSSNSWDFQDPRTQSMNEIYTCKRYLMGDPNIQESEINNIFTKQSENVCVIDSGCPKSVMSQMWANTYEASLRNTKKFQNYPFKEKKEHKLLRFGPSRVYTSTTSMKIPIVLGEEVKEVEVSVVHANIPFLLGRDYLDKWDCEVTFKENSMIINKKKKVKLETNQQGHIILRNENALFITDECTRYTRGQGIKSKQPKEVTEAIEDNWVRKGPGWPSKGFYSYRGTDFCNSLMKEYSRKLGLSHRTTPSFSPWANQQAV